jgi:esterase
MNLFYKEVGSGQPLVIVHGLFGSGDNWATLAKRFANHFHVITLDLRNHGHSPHAGEMNYEVMAEDVFDTIATLGLRDVHLLGHSMGGKVVLRFAQLYAFLVNKVIVADIAPRYYAPHHSSVIGALRALDFEKIKSRSEAATILHEHLNDASTEQFLLKSLYWKAEGKLALRFNLDVLETNIEQIGAAMPTDIIENDVLFIRGGNSRYIKDEDWPVITSFIPHARLETIDGAGHWLHADRPEVFAEFTDRFLTH